MKQITMPISVSFDYLKKDKNVQSTETRICIKFETPVSEYINAYWIHKPMGQIIMQMSVSFDYLKKIKYVQSLKHQ